MTGCLGLALKSTPPHIVRKTDETGMAKMLIKVKLGNEQSVLWVVFFEKVLEIGNGNGHITL